MAKRRGLLDFPAFLGVMRIEVAGRLGNLLFTDGHECPSVNIFLLVFLSNDLLFSGSLGWHEIGGAVATTLNLKIYD